jgi:hypothetical protein
LVSLGSTSSACLGQLDEASSESPTVGLIQNGFYWDIENEEQKTTGKTGNFREFAEKFGADSVTPPQM